MVRSVLSRVICSHHSLGAMRLFLQAYAELCGLAVPNLLPVGDGRSGSLSDGLPDHREVCELTVDPATHRSEVVRLRDLFLCWGAGKPRMWWGVGPAAVAGQSPASWRTGKSILQSVRPP
jgi:hypothetical protein